MRGTLAVSGREMFSHCGICNAFGTASADIGREKAEELLRDEPEGGVFLMRKSQTKSDAYVLCVREGNRVCLASDIPLSACGANNEYSLNRLPTISLQRCSRAIVPTIRLVISSSTLCRICYASTSSTTSIPRLSFAQSKSGSERCEPSTISTAKTRKICHSSECLYCGVQYCLPFFVRSLHLCMR